VLESSLEEILGMPFERSFVFLSFIICF